MDQSAHKTKCVECSTRNSFVKKTVLHSYFSCVPCSSDLLLQLKRKKKKHSIAMYVRTICFLDCHCMRIANNPKMVFGELKNTLTLNAMSFCTSLFRFFFLIFISFDWITVCLHSMITIKYKFQSESFSSLSKLCKCAVVVCIVYTMFMKHEYFFVCFNTGIKKKNKKAAEEKYDWTELNFRI